MSRLCNPVALWRLGNIYRQKQVIMLNGNYDFGIMRTGLRTDEVDGKKKEEEEVVDDLEEDEEDDDDKEEEKKEEEEETI